jgi:hypothetical protein
MEYRNLIDRYKYHGPALTPAEVNARVKEARRDALEEAAKRAEQGTYGEEFRDGWWAAARKYMAAEIRAMKGEGND